MTQKSINQVPALLAAACVYVAVSCAPASKEAPTERKWWKEAVVYQIYPRSFKDSDDDGVGDLPGIISKLDYIKSLGVDVVWLNPVYQSPNYDNGYDISDYRSIMPEFGTMADFENLLGGLHERNIRLVMDLVVNHSSHEHEWFKQSRSSRDNPYRNYYHWWPAEKGMPPPRFSFFDEEGDAWQYDSLTNAYYLHYFADQQPDLNWENPAVRQEVIDIMRFWIAKGVDGFRLDAFQYAAKDTTFPRLPAGYEKNINKYYGMQPQLHTYLKEMHREVFSQADVMTVAEGAGSSFQDAHDLVDAHRQELQTAYHFEAIDIGKQTGNYSLLDFKKVFSRWDSAFATDGWLAIYLANHDNARMVSRFGNDSEAFRERSSKMLTTFVLTMRGTPYYYYGDELGMTNIRFSSIDQYRDIDTRNRYKKIQSEGGDLNQFLEDQKRVGRDNGRTPFQWDATPQAGFTSGTPWLPVNPNYTVINAATQENDPNSVLNYFRSAMALRKNHLALVYGAYQLLDAANPQVYAYTREWQGDRLLVLLNFSGTPAAANVGVDVAKAERVLCNYSEGETSLELRPYEAAVFRLK
jgi:oligo-1,6-glucosidase